MSAVRIDTLPTAGTLTLSGAAVTAGQVITAADLTAGNLVFTPVTDANGAVVARNLTLNVLDSATGLARKYTLRYGGSGTRSLDDLISAINTGKGGGQEVMHLHIHVFGGGKTEKMAEVMAKL
jgi:hypothetical protein